MRRSLGVLLLLGMTVAVFVSAAAAGRSASPGLAATSGYPTGNFGPPDLGASTTLAVAITSTSATSITVASSAGFPTSPQFTIYVDNEQMTVTAESGTGNTTWTVSRGANATPATTHAAGAAISMYQANSYALTKLGAAITSTSATSITVTSSASFPATPQFVIEIDHEEMVVTAESGTGNKTWTVTRGAYGTQRATHTAGATVQSGAGTDCNTLPYEIFGCTTYQLPSFVTTTLAAATTSSATSITVTSSSGFSEPPPFIVTIGSELLTVTAESGTGDKTWTVIRGAYGSIATTHAASAAVGFDSPDGTLTNNAGLMVTPGVLDSYHDGAVTSLSVLVPSSYPLCQAGEPVGVPATFDVLQFHTGIVTPGGVPQFVTAQSGVEYLCSEPNQPGGTLDTFTFNPGLPVEDDKTGAQPVQFQDFSMIALNILGAYLPLPTEATSCSSSAPATGAEIAWFPDGGTNPYDPYNFGYPVGWTYYGAKPVGTWPLNATIQPDWPKDLSLFPYAGIEPENIISNSAPGCGRLLMSGHVTALGPDGSGRLSATTTPSTVTRSSAGNKIVFTYTAGSEQAAIPAGGMNGGELVLTVPSGWSVPSTKSTDPGYTTASAGQVSVGGQKIPGSVKDLRDGGETCPSRSICVSLLTLAAGGSMTITYSDAKASSVAGTQTWSTAQSANMDGVEQGWFLNGGYSLWDFLEPLVAGSPAITVH